MLDREREDGARLRRGGRPLRTVAARGPATSCASPVDVAVDPFRNTYVADEEAGVLRLLAAGPAPGHARRGRAAQPEALTLDPAGAVLVYDDKAREGSLRYRMRRLASTSARRGCCAPPCVGAAVAARPGRKPARLALADAAQRELQARPGPAGARAGRVRRRPAEPLDRALRRDHRPPRGAAPRRARCRRAGEEILVQAYELRGRAYFNIGLQEKAAEQLPLRSCSSSRSYTLSKEKVSPEDRRLLQLGEEGAGGLPGRVLAAGRARASP